MKKKNPFLEPSEVDFYLINKQPTSEEEAHLSKLIQQSKSKHKGVQKENNIYAH